MKVFLDLTALLPEATGVDNYLLRLTDSLGRIDQESSYVVCINQEDRERLPNLPANFRILAASRRPRWSRLMFQQMLLPAFSTIGRSDVVHSPSFLLPLARGTPRHLLTIHDMTSFTMPDAHIRLRRSWSYRKAIMASIRSADLVTVPSKATEKAVLELIPGVSPERIRVIEHAIGEEFYRRPQPEVQAVLRKLGLDSPYILYVGTIEPRKNVVRLLDAYARVLRDYKKPIKLVLAGRLGWGFEPILERMAAADVATRIRHLGYVAQEDLPYIYSGALIFVYPSLFEGFGVPPLEAMACGAPTVSGRTSSLTENLEGAAELVEPEDTEALAAVLRRLLSDDSARQALAERGKERSARFRWNETGRRTLDLYRELAGRDKA
jgi:glycosyltransferase involved in cell wall biosynthesis